MKVLCNYEPYVKLKEGEISLHEMKLHETEVTQYYVSYEIYQNHMKMMKFQLFHIMCSI